MSWSFSSWCRGWTRPFLLPVARFFGRLGLSPNGVSMLGLISYGGIGCAIGLGHPLLAGVLLAVLGPLDAVDGLLAREQGRVTRFGAFLDSCLDRYAEYFLFLGLAVFFHQRGDGFAGELLVLFAFSGSLLVSYTRARAEALGFSCTVGMLTRFERLFILAVGLLFGWILPALAVIAVLAHVTAFQRMFHVYRKSRHEAGEARRPDTHGS